MPDVLRFWMRKGVDGFRGDVICHLIKDAALRDNPPNPHYKQSKPPNETLIQLYTTDLPEVHDVIAILRRTVDEFSDRLLSEIYTPCGTSDRILWTQSSRCCASIFSLLGVRWDAKYIQALIADYEGAVPKGGVAELGAWQS